MTDREKELYNIAEILCECISDGPAGCDACWLQDDDDNDDERSCDFNRFCERFKDE